MKTFARFLVLALLLLASVCALVAPRAVAGGFDPLLEGRVLELLVRRGILSANGTVAITGGTITGITDLAVADGGTGASTAAAARTALGVPNVFSAWVAGQGIHPTSNSAALDVHGSTLHGVYAFDATTAESIIYEGVMGAAYDSTRDLTVTVYVVSPGTSGNPVVFSAEVEAIVAGTLDIDSDSFDTAVLSTSTATSTTSGIAVAVTIALDNGEADAIVAGAPYRLRIARVPGDAGDTLASDADVLRVVVSQ